MAISTIPRSVSDATRFTPTTPHASTKPGSSSSGSSRFPPPAGGRRKPPPSQTPVPISETPEQRVARLRAAHLAAKNAEVSRFDRVVGSSRRFLDSAHKFTVVGLIGFTAIAGLLTIYTSYDMLSHNRKRKAEFFQVQRRLEADSLEAARLAYMRGDATEEQIQLVEEANERAAAGGGGSGGIFKMPNILGPPAAVKTDSDANTEWNSSSERPSVSQAATWPAQTSLREGKEDQGLEGTGDGKAKKQGGFRAWLFSGLKSNEEGEDLGSSERRLGWESLSEDDDTGGIRESDVVRAIEDKQAYVKAKAKAAFEKERENQRRGGMLDRVGLEDQEKKKVEEQPKKKGWLW